MRIIQADANNSTNKMVGSFFGDPIPENENAADYLELKNSSAHVESGNYILNIGGVGFWRNESLTKLESNKAYLYHNDYDPSYLLDQYQDDSTPIGAGYMNPGYIFQFEDGTMTAIKDITATKTIKSVRYFNVAGIESTQPFDGINIVVTNYSDGTKSAIKVLR